MTMARILAVDFGSRRVGVAVSDPLGIIALPLDTLHVGSREEAVRQIVSLCRSYEAATVIMGYPLGNSGNKTAQTRVVDAVIRMIEERSGLPVVKWDERYTSVQAEDMLRSQGVGLREQKGRIDAMAARIILQEYLDTRGGAR